MNGLKISGQDAGQVDVNSTVYAKAKADLTAAGYNFGPAVPKNV
jgi:hypothetical protein